MTVTKVKRQRAAGARSHEAAPRLLTLGDLDGRTAAAQQAKALAAAVLADLGGPEHVSALQARMIETVATLSAMASDQSARWLLGEAVDIQQFGTLVNAMNRTSVLLGLKAVKPDSLPDLYSYSAAATAKAQATEQREDIADAMVAGDEAAAASDAASAGDDVAPLDLQAWLASQQRPAGTAPKSNVGRGHRTMALRAGHEPLPRGRKKASTL